MFIPLLGTENDEAFFAAPLFPPSYSAYSVQWFHREIPLMLMTYLGAVKTWIYAPVFKIWAPTPFSIRVPALLIGTLTVWLFYKLLQRVAGDRVAAIGCALLATDSLFLLTTVFDWGPVALQHLFLVAGVLLTVRYYQIRRWSSLAGAFFLFGLGMWDKALFAWMLGGLGVATLVTFPRELFRLLTPRRAGLALACFCLGASPLILFNAENHLQTFRDNTKLVPSEIPPEFVFLAETIDSGLFGWMVPDDFQVPRPAAPKTALQHASAALGRITGNPQKGLFAEAFLAALLLWPLMLFRGKGPHAGGMLFALVFLAVAWVQMAMTKGAGGSIHHTILIWPFPEMFVALALGAAWQAPWNQALRWICGAAAALVVASNLLVLNTYHAQMVRNGGTLGWTDGIYSLARFMKTTPGEVFALDWGIIENLRLLDAGTLPLRVGWEPVITSAPTHEQKEMFRAWMALPNSVFIAHPAGSDFFAGGNANAQALAKEFGLKRETLAAISDRRGTPRFEVFRFHP